MCKASYENLWEASYDGNNLSGGQNSLKNQRLPAERRLPLLGAFLIPPDLLVVADFVSLSLGGENILIDKSFANKMRY